LNTPGELTLSDAICSTLSCSGHGPPKIGGAKKEIEENLAKIKPGKGWKKA
jgi:hypothetical protein